MATASQGNAYRPARGQRPPIGLRRLRASGKRLHAVFLEFGSGQLPFPGACRTWGVESENRPQRGQFLPDLQAHSPAMGQKDGEKWTAAVDLQPTLPKSDRLQSSFGHAGCVIQNLVHWSRIQDRQGAHGLQDACRGLGISCRLNALSRRVRASSSSRMASLFMERWLRSASRASQSFNSGGILLISRVAPVMFSSMASIWIAKRYLSEKLPSTRRKDVRHLA